MEFDRSQLVQKPAQCFGIRHLQYLLLITLIIVAYGMRVSFNIAIIAMLSDKKSDNYPTYPEWTDHKQILLSGFFWGYIGLQILAGQLGKKFGAKYPLLCAFILTSLLTISLPFFGSSFGYKGVLACRIMQGLSQGFIFPSIHTLLSVWSPLSERTKYGAIVYAGSPVGNVIAMPVAGAIAASSAGWPLTFYLYGALGLCWSVFWIFFGASTPASSRWISEEEKKWIYYELGETEDREKIVTPWKSILTSFPFFALLITHCGQNWGYWTLLTEIPSYMSSILKYDIASNSLMSTLPYFAMFIMNLTMSQIADLLLKKGILSMEVCRKLFNTIGVFTPALSLITLCLVGVSNKNVVIFLLVLAVSSNAGVNCGMNLNHIDLSPIHAGTLMAMTNSSAAIFSILAPLAVGGIESITGYTEKDEALWNIVFYVTAGVLMCVGIVFNVVGSTKIQPWNMAVTKEGKLSISNNKPVEIQKKISVIYQAG